MVDFLWFQVLGVYEWSGNNPLPPEIWLFPYLLPCHPGLYLTALSYTIKTMRGLLIAVEWLCPQFLGYKFPCFLLIGRMWCHCRMVYLPMSYLYGKRFVGPITPTIRSLRKELYTVPYHEIDWNEARNLCAKVGKNYTFFSPLSFYI